MELRKTVEREFHNVVPFVRQFVPLTVSLISCDFISDENVEEHFDEDSSGNLFLLLPYSVLYVEKLMW